MRDSLSPASLANLEDSNTATTLHWPQLEGEREERKEEEDGGREGVSIQAEMRGGRLRRGG